MKRRDEQPKPIDPTACPYGLNLVQQSAVDLLAAGRTDAATAEALAVHRVTVTRWRLYSPGFRAALSAQRAAVWGVASDRLRSLLPAAVDALAAALAEATDPKERLAVAVAILKAAGPPPTEPTDPADVLRAEVAKERTWAKDVFQSRFDMITDQPPMEEHIQSTAARLAILAPA